MPVPPLDPTDPPASRLRDPVEFGTCPDNWNSSDCGFVGFEIASSYAYPCWGEVNNPRYHYTNYKCSNDAPSCPSSEVILKPFDNTQVPTGFSFEGAIQFFNLPGYGTTELREHSAVTFHWDSVGKLLELELTNYKGDFTRTSLWLRDDDGLNHPLDPSVLQTSSSCPINPGTDAIVLMDSSEPTSKPSGFLARVFSILANFDVDSSDFDYGTSSDPSNTGCLDAIKNQYYQATIDCDPEIISSDDPTLTGNCREMGLHFDSAGLLKKVYFGDSDYCESIPCIWDRDNPPENTAGVVVPILKLRDDCIGSYSDIELWMVHFASTGHYIKACLYASFCGCAITDNRPDGESPACICEEYACIVTGNCLRPGNPGYCPDTATFTCAEAAINAGNCAPTENLYCVFSFNNDCCTGVENISSSVVPSDPSSAEGEACQMAGDAGAACTS